MLIKSSSYFQKNNSSQLLKYLKKPQNVSECSCPCHRQYQNHSENISFELNEGQAENLKDEFRTKTNKIHSMKYQKIFIPTLIYKFFSKPRNLFFFIVSLLVFIQGIVPPINMQVLRIPWLLSFCTFVACEIYNMYELKNKSDNENNEKQVSIVNFNENKEERIKWKNLKIGHLILLNHGDICPADTLILDCSDTKLFVETSNLDGLSFKTPKFPLKSTYIDKYQNLKGNCLRFRNVLNGEIEFEIPNTFLDSFNGYLKLKKDPKPESININNIVLRNSIVYYSRWMIGMVLHVGNDTKIMKISKFHEDESSWFEKINDKYDFVLIVLIILITLVNYLLMISKSKVSIGYTEISPTANFLNFLILYSLFLPLSLSLISILQKFLVKIKFERFYRKKDLFFKINGLKSLQNLSMISHVLLDKTGTMTNGNILVRSIYVLDKIYLFDVEKRKKSIPKIRINEDFQVSKSKSIKLDSDNEIPIEIKVIDNKNIVRDFFQSASLNKGTTIESTFNDSFFRHAPKKISFEIEPLEFNPNTSILKKISLDNFKKFSVDVEDDENKTGNNDKKFLSPDSRTKKKNKDSLNFSMRYSRYLTKTNSPVFKNMVEESDIFGLQEDLKINDDSVNALKSLILCHNAKTLIREGNTLKFYHTNDEFEIIKFCTNIGYKFERIGKFPNKMEYMININGKEIKYDVLGINYYSKKNDRGRFSIVLKDMDLSSEKPAILYVKGSNRHIINNLEMDDKKRNEILACIQIENTKGRRAIIYAMRELDSSQSNEYKTNYDTLHSNFNVEDDTLQAFYSKIEVKLKLVCIVFVEDCLRANMLSSLRLFCDLNLKIWILSGDSFERTMCTAFLSKILDPEDQLSIIKCSSLQEAQLSIKTNLKLVRRFLGYENENASPVMVKGLKHKYSTISDKGKLSLFADGNSLDLILNDENLSDHLFFILNFCKSFVGYRLTPFHKGIIAKKIKEKFLNNPLVLSFGDGFNDNLMFEASDSSICFVDKNINNDKGDILISGWDVISNLMINSCHLTKNFEDSYQFLYSSFVLFFFSNYFYSWYSNFNGSGIYKNPLVFYVFLIHSGIFTIFLSFFKLTNRENFSNSLKIQYKLLTSNKSKIILKFVFFGTIISLILVVFCFYFALYVLNSFYDFNGFETTLDTAQAIYLMIFFALKTIKIFVSLKWNQIPKFFICLIIILLLGAMGFAISYMFSLDTDFLNYNLERIFHEPCLISTVILIVGISSEIFYFFLKLSRKIFSKYGTLTYSETIKETIQIKESQKLGNMIEINKNFAINNLIRKIFVNSKCDSMIDEMVNPTESITKLDFHKYSLSFSDEALERKYTSYKIKRNLNKIRIFYFATLILYCIYLMSNYFYYELISDDVNIFYIKISLCGFILFNGIVVITDYYEKYYARITLFYVLFVTFAKISLDAQSYEDQALGVSIIPLVCVNMMLPPYVTIGISFFTVLVSYLKTENFYQDSHNMGLSNIHSIGFAGKMRVFLLISYFILLFSITFLANYYNYCFQKINRLNFLAKYKLENKSKQINDLLSILLPGFVKNLIDQGQTCIEQDQGEVVIIFCDLCDFDKMIEAESIKIVDILDNLFRKFDKFCFEFGIQKIETVGKTYMACAGLLACEVSVASHIISIEKTRRAINLALKIKKCCNDQIYGEMNKMKLKIGIHVGRVIAGVIGHHKPQFSLIGDTVNTTSRVCSTAIDGTITISEEAYNKVKDGDFLFQLRRVEAKGKGMINTYILLDEGEYQYLQNNSDFMELTKNSKLDFTSLKLTENMASIRLYENKNSPKKDELKTLPKKKSLKELNFSIKEKSLQKVDENEELIGDIKFKHRVISKFKMNDDVYHNIKEDKELLIPNLFFLTASKNQEALYEEFQKNLLTKNKTRNNMTLLLMFFITLIKLLISLGIRSDYYLYSTFTFILIVVFLVLLLLFILLKEKLINSQKKYYTSMLLGILIYGIQAIIIENHYLVTPLIEKITLLHLMTIIIFGSRLNGIYFVHCLILSISVLVPWLVCIFIGKSFENYFKTLEQLFFIITFCGYNMVETYLIQYSLIENFNNLRNLDNRQQQQKNLLEYLLPSHIRDKFLEDKDKSKRQDFTEEFSQVTLLFADIAGFTKYSSSVTPEQVVKMLRDLFTEFDKMCLNYNVYKVYTIGDCYVVSGLVNANEKRDPIEEAANVLCMGISMIDIIKKVRSRINFQELDMRIGIHTGTIIGGIIGTGVVRYDIYGKDVMIANKMESNGVQGKICLSEVTKKLLENRFEELKFEFHKELDLSSIHRQIKCYLLEEDDRLSSNEL